MVQIDSLLQPPEGSDITAADMVQPPEEASEIVEFFADSTIFLTGATGYIGKMFLEKLLRTCPNLRMVYILIRPKKGKETQTRFEEVFAGPSFEPLKRKNPHFARKVGMISGDCCLEDLGLAEADRTKLIAEVDCVIHCAATVRFDEKLRTAANINVRCVKDLLKMAKQMRNLRAMIHISTAFSQCIRKNIDETFYEPPIEPDKLMALVDALDDDKLDKFTPILLGDFPNTYVFTKAIAEAVVAKEGQSLPIALVRPSIVIASVKEPVAGWIDNMYGATGVLLGAATGLLRSLHGRKENVAEMVPADYVVNSALAAAWDIATIKSLNDNKETKEQHSLREEKFEKEVPVYNFVSSPQAPITWSDFTSLSEKHCKSVPSPVIVWNYFFKMRPNRLLHLLAVLFYHKVPAYIVDFIAICIGKQPMLVKGYQKIDKFGEVISYFSMREWTFKNNNVQALWKKMGPGDRALFEFGMDGFNWESYFYTYVRGARVYLLKDPLDTIPQGKIKYYKLKVAHYVLITIVGICLLKLVMLFYNFLLH